MGQQILPVTQDGRPRTPLQHGVRGPGAPWSTKCCRKPCTPFQCEVGDPVCLDRVRLSIPYAWKPCVAPVPGGLRPHRGPCLGLGTLTSCSSFAPSLPRLSLGPFLSYPSFHCVRFILDKLKGTFNHQWAGPMVVK